MLLAVRHWIMVHLGSLESTQEARVALGYRVDNSYSSFVLSKLSARTILDGERQGMNQLLITKEIITLLEEPRNRIQYT